MLKREKRKRDESARVFCLNDEDGNAQRGGPPVCSVLRPELDHVTRCDRARGKAKQYLSARSRRLFRKQLRIVCNVGAFLLTVFARLCMRFIRFL